LRPMSLHNHSPCCAGSMNLWRNHAGIRGLTVICPYLPVSGHCCRRSFQRGDCRERDYRRQTSRCFCAPAPGRGQQRRWSGCRRHFAVVNAASFVRRHCSWTACPWHSQRPFQRPPPWRWRQCKLCSIASFSQSISLSHTWYVVGIQFFGGFSPPSGAHSGPVVRLPAAPGIHFYSCRNATTLRGGKVNTAEQGCPCDLCSSDTTPPRFPTLLPP